MSAPAASSTRPGLFITFEGGDGVGKGTQIDRVVAHLESLGRRVTVTREPGGTDFGAQIRAILLNPERGGLDVRTEALLFAADRAEHVASRIRPALATGDVISDRFADSSEAYQSAAGGLDPAAVRALSDFAAAGLVPDLTVILDADPAIAQARVTTGEFGKADRYEAEALAFHRGVRAGFLTIAAREPNRCVVVDAARDIDAVTADVLAAVDATLATRTRDWGTRWGTTRP